MSKKKYIDCTTHGRTTGYAICRHIVEQQKPVRAVYEPSPNAEGIRQTIGDIVCFEKPAKEHTADELVLVCRRCAIAHGWTRILAS